MTLKTTRTLLVAVLMGSIMIAGPAAFTKDNEETKSADKATTESHKKKAAAKDLKNANCPVSGQPVGSMEKGAEVTYKGYKIGLCCNSCKATFMKKPDFYLDELLKAQKQ